MLYKEKIKKQIKVILIIKLIIILIASGISFGKTFCEMKLEAKTEIAKPILQIENDLPINIKGTEEKNIYNIKVKNYNEYGEITQVNLEYYIEIINQADEKIGYKIYKENTELDLDKNTTEKFLLQKEKKQEENYQIEILFNENSVIDEMKKEIKIKVYAIQIND